MTERSETTFGDYRLWERLGAGGMAAAYVGERRGAEEPCVVKVIRDEANEMAIARMRKEAHAGIHLQHPNIVRTLDAGSVSGVFYIAVELIVGVDLRRVLAAFAGHATPHELVVGVLRQALRGLAYAHAAVGPAGEPLGIVHRDLSLANVMLDDAGRVKLIDFGLVHAQLGDARTRPGMVLGTLAYVAPEQAVGDPVDARSDLYALSAVAYELLTGLPVARGHVAGEVMRSILTDTPPPIRSLRSDVPEALAAAIHRGLAKDRNDRHADADAYHDALASLDAYDEEALREVVADHFPELAHRRSRWTAQAEGAPTPVLTRAEVLPELEPPKLEPPKRRRRIGFGVGLAALGVGAVLVATLRSADAPEAEPPRAPRAPIAPIAPIAQPQEPTPGVVQREVVEAAPPVDRPGRKPRRRRAAPPAPAPAPSPPPAEAPPRVVAPRTVEQRIEGLDARLRRLAERGIDVQSLRARIRFIRASGQPPEDAIEAVERDTATLEASLR